MTVTALTSALALALADLDEPHKAGKANTGTYGYTYLTLPDLSRAVRRAFAAHGLAFTQAVTVVDGGVEVVTRVLHSSGETWTTGPLWMPSAARNPQAIGSAISYARRYQLAALVGLSGSDDDDGAHASGAEPQPQAAVVPARKGKPGGSAPAPPPAVKSRMTVSQRRLLWKQARSKGYGDKVELAGLAAGTLNVPLEQVDLSELTIDQASALIDALAAVQVSERLTETPPDDPWAQPPAEGQ